MKQRKLSLEYPCLPAAQAHRKEMCQLPSALYMSSIPGQETEETLTAAEAMLLIKDSEEAHALDLDKKEKNRIAARRSREKKHKHIAEQQNKLALLSRKSQEYAYRLDKTAGIIEELIEELHSALSIQQVNIYRMLQILLPVEDFLAFSSRHKAFLQKIKAALAQCFLSYN